MASLFNFDLSKSNISILDAGAGTGILSTAVIDRLISEGYNGKIHLTCYETDKLVLPLLELNLKILSSKYGIDYTIIHKNYITSQSFDSRSLFPEEKHEFDYIIGNPPYLKIAKDAEEAKAMPSVCYGSPNLYFLFWAMGIHNLKQEHELVYIVPRSWTSGAYFKSLDSTYFNIVSLQTFIYLKVETKFLMESQSCKKP